FPESTLVRPERLNKSGKTLTLASPCNMRKGWPCMAKRTRPIATAAVRPFKALFASDAFAGILLIFVAVMAIAVTNSPLAHQYHQFFHGELPWTPIPKLHTLHLWINDG